MNEQRQMLLDRIRALHVADPKNNFQEVLTYCDNPQTSDRSACLVAEIALGVHEASELEALTGREHSIRPFRPSVKA